MVSFIPAGRMGNFLFKTATAISYSLKHGLQFTVPLETNDQFWNPIYLTHLQNKDYDKGLETVTIPERGHEYNELPFEEHWRKYNILIDGWVQSERYFLEYREEILHLFNFPYELKPICSIHARFGDYLYITGKHILLDERYLTEAMALIKEKTGIEKFKVFSDDLPLFKNKFGNLYDFEYSTNTNEIDDLIEMSCCHSSINSSSTFSWWSAWLNRNPDKVIVTPDKWFQDGWDNCETKDIVPPPWIKI